MAKDSVVARGNNWKLMKTLAGCGHSLGAELLRRLRQRAEVQVSLGNLKPYHTHKKGKYFVMYLFDIIRIKLHTYREREQQ